MIRVQRQGGALGDVRQAFNASLPARWALVDVSFARRNCLGVTPAIRVAATGALGLWQRVQNALGQRNLVVRLRPVRLLRCRHLRYQEQRLARLPLPLPLPQAAGLRWQQVQARLARLAWP